MCCECNGLFITMLELLAHLLLIDVNIRESHLPLCLGVGSLTGEVA